MKQLNRQGYDAVPIQDYVVLLENLKVQLEAFHSEKLNAKTEQRQDCKTDRRILYKGASENEQTIDRVFRPQRDCGARNQ